MDMFKQYTDGTVSHPNRVVELNRPDAEPDVYMEGEPVYEVESIIGHKGNGINRHYRVKWVGWPIEQSTWQSLDDVQQCMNLVHQYEQTITRQARSRHNRRRVNTIGTAATGKDGKDKELQQQIEQAEIISLMAKPLPSVEQQLQINMARMKTGGRIPPILANIIPPVPGNDIQAAIILSEEERSRIQFQQAARDTKPVAADRPAINKKGEVPMGTQRCTSNTKAGGHCKSATRHGEYCWIHRLQHHGLRVAKSNIPGAGKGLFAGKVFNAGDRIAIYSGDLLKGDAHVDEQYRNSIYLLQMSATSMLDAARTNAGDGRLVNDSRGTQYKNNARLCTAPNTKSACIRATHRINGGEEILVSYGNSYWNRHEPVRKSIQRLMDRPIKKKVKFMDIQNDEPDRPRVRKTLGTTKDTPIIINTTHISYLHALRTSL
jgi:hypothetical protein